jgi:hypothetical protein
MYDFKSRIRRLEEKSAAGDAATLGRLLRACNRTGSMDAGIASLELKRPLDPSFVLRAGRTQLQCAAMADALFALAP